MSRPTELLEDIMRMEDPKKPQQPSLKSNTANNEVPSIPKAHHDPDPAEEEIGLTHREKRLKMDLQQRCGFYLEKKKRTCRLLAMKDSDTCAEHSTTTKGGISSINNGNETGDDHGRVPCPLDPRHNCAKDKLEKHLEVCNARKRTPTASFYSASINSISEQSSTAGRSLSDLSIVELKDLIERISNVYSKWVSPELIEDIHQRSYSLMDDDIKDPNNGHEARRHLIQTASLISLLGESVLSRVNTCFVELGCGKGGMTYWVGQGVEALSKDPSSNHFLLIDRKSHRHKRDNKLRKEDTDNIERLRIDLKDVRLDQLPCVNQKERIVAFSKHLCGGATDLALSSLLRTNGFQAKVSEIAIATCCHHQCDWSCFVGQKSLLDWGFHETHFKALTGISSWAVCGTGKSKFGDSESESSYGNNEKYIHLSLTLGDRRRLGREIKGILDQARINFIKSFGLQAKLVKYVPLDQTYENTAIVCFQDPPSTSSSQSQNSDSNK